MSRKRERYEDEYGVWEHVEEHGRHVERWKDKFGKWEKTVEYDDYRRPKLRRNKIDGILGGVCAGLGDWLGIDHGVVRIFTVLAVIFAGFPVILYFLMWLFIPSDKRAPYVREDRERRRAEKDRKTPSEKVAPTTSYSDVRSKFRSLEERLQDLERSVTSREWKLRRDFRDLES